jgi:hypothetical protein
MTTEQNMLTVNLVKPLDKKTTVRAMYRFDGFRVKDWHYDGVIHNAMAAYDSGTMLLDSGVPNYHVNTFGVFLNYNLLSVSYEIPWGQKLAPFFRLLF